MGGSNPLLPCSVCMPRRLQLKPSSRTGQRPGAWRRDSGVASARRDCQRSRRLRTRQLSARTSLARSVAALHSERSARTRHRLGAAAERADPAALLAQPVPGPRAAAHPSRLGIDGDLAVLVGGPRLPRTLVNGAPTPNGSRLRSREDGPSRFRARLAVVRLASRSLLVRARRGGRQRRAGRSSASSDAWRSSVDCDTQPRRVA